MSPTKTTLPAPPEPSKKWVPRRNDDEPLHCHFDCFSGAAGDMILAAALDCAGQENDKEALLYHVDTCLRKGLPALAGEFALKQRRVWRGSGQIAANYVMVESAYQHQPAPVPEAATAKSKRATTGAISLAQKLAKDPELDNAQHKTAPSSSSSAVVSSASSSSNNNQGSRNKSRRSISDGKLAGFNGSATTSRRSFSDSKEHLLIQSLEVDDENNKKKKNNNQNSTTSDLMEILNQSLTLQNSNSSAMQLSPSSSARAISPKPDAATVATSASTTAINGSSHHQDEHSHSHDHDHHHHQEGHSHGHHSHHHEHHHQHDASVDPEAHHHGHEHEHSHNHDASPPDATPHSHDHSHGHGHSHSHSHHHNHSSSSDHGPLRNLPEIRAMLEQAPKDYISPWVCRTAIAAFTALAHAESTVHGAASIEQVHFHEVGAVDSIVDTVGSLVALEALGCQTFSCSRLPLGEGTVRTAHGLLPVPAPATLRLMIGMPTTPGPPGVSGELVTPTAAALLRTLVLGESSAETVSRGINSRSSSSGDNKKKSAAHGIHRPPQFTLHQVGLGAGTKNFEAHPNVIRLMLGTV